MSDSIISQFPRFSSDDCSHPGTEEVARFLTKNASSGRGYEEEIHFLKREGDMIRDELEAIDSRIKELENEKAQGGGS